MFSWESLKPRQIYEAMDHVLVTQSMSWLISLVNFLGIDFQGHRNRFHLTSLIFVTLY